MATVTKAPINAPIADAAEVPGCYHEVSVSAWSSTTHAVGMGRLGGGGWLMVLVPYSYTVTIYPEGRSIVCVHWSHCRWLIAVYL